jgi:hypothetical protein
VRKWIVFVIAAMACSRGPGPGSSLTGANTPREAVSAFLNAARAQDLQAMAMVWGNSRGPSRDQFDRQQLDQRLIIMQGCYDHDRFQILDESPAAAGERTVRVTLSRGARSKTTNFTAARGPSNRYYVYVQDTDFNAFRDFCS